MAQKWTAHASGTNTDRIAHVSDAAAHLSDGTLVQLSTDGTSFFLEYSSDHSTLNSIATISATFLGAYAVVVDSSDNIYVLGAASFSLIVVQAFVKGAGYTWTAKTALTGSTSSGAAVMGQVVGVWCNTGGGTSSAGHLMTVWLNSSSGNGGYAICDAGAALAGSGTLVTAQSSQPTFMGGAVSVDFYGELDISNDGFGATSGIVANVISGTGGGYQVGAWAVSSAGALTTNTQISANVSAALPAASARLRVIRYASNAWAIVAPSTGDLGRYSIARYSSTAQLTAPTDSGAPTNMPLVAGSSGSGTAALGWDAFLDPVTAGKVWVIAETASAATVYAVSAAVGSGVTWAGAATLQDTLSPWVANNAVSLRAVKQPRGAIVDWQVNAETAATPTYALLGDYSQFASAPNAPTISTPANGAFLDATAGVTFGPSTYNSTDGGNQNAYALRLKVSGGSYNYWNAGTSSWQGTIVWNSVSTAPGATWSVGPINTGISNANTYNWSEASQEALGSLQGPFASDLTFTAQAGPSVVVTGPTGSVTTTTAPTATWTTTPAPGTSQTAYRVVVEHGSYGTVPGSGTQDWDSGTVSGSNQSRQIGVNLANGTTYRVFVQVTETGGILSSWAFQTFTESLDLPQTPTITAVAGTDPATGNPRVVLTVQGQDNVLTATQASFEDGTTTGWAAGASTAIANTTAQALDGTHAMSLTRQSTTGAASATTPTGTSGFPVTPGKPWQALANFRSAVTARSCTIQVLWYQASGAASAIRASDTSAGVNDTTTGWTQAALAVTSPADAAFAAVVVSVAAAVANEVHYVDNIDLGPGSNAVWTRGGLVGSTTVAILRSDGTYVRGATPTTPTAIAGPSQSVVVNDYEAALNQAYTYTAVVSAVVGGSTISSAASAPSASATTTSRFAWLAVPGVPASNLQLWIAKFDPTTRSVSQGITAGIGNPTEFITSDVYRKRHGKLTLSTLDMATRDTLQALLLSGNVLLLQRPSPDPAVPGLQLYFLPVGDVTEDKFSARANTRERTLSVAIVEQPAP